jgi:hypothetical protein
MHLRIAILDGLAPELQALVHRDGLQIGFGQQALVGLLPGVDMDGGNGGGVARDRGADLVQGHDVQQGKKRGNNRAPKATRMRPIVAAAASSRRCTGRRAPLATPEILLIQ